MAVNITRAAPLRPQGEEMLTILNCEDEPIRIPGSIQQHGFMLLLDKRGEHIVAASENAEEFLALPLKLILGASVDTILEREVLAALRAGIRSDETGSLLTFLGSFKMRDELYSVVTHRVGDIRVLEFERLDHLVSPELMNSVITNFVATLSKLNSETELLQAITRQVKDLTGFDRVLLYRFDQAGHGTVLTEENNGTLPSYLDLRFPATDIPRQARELYVLNTVRIIPDATYVPSPLRATAQGTVEGLDLSMSLLRSVSPVHLEYMRNMGTLSSMSISIVCDGKLWGLISGHHATPHSVPYLVRSACDLLTRIVSSQLMAFRTASKLEKMMHFHNVHRRMLTHMAAENDYVAAIASQMSYLAQVTDGDGAALIIDGHCEMHGQTPGEQAIRRLAAWMDAQPELMLFESRPSEAGNRMGRRDQRRGEWLARRQDLRCPAKLPHVVSPRGGEHRKLGRRAPDAERWTKTIAIEKRVFTRESHSESGRKWSAGKVRRGLKWRLNRRANFAMHS